MAKKLIKNYSFTPGVGLDADLRPGAYSLISQNRTFIIKEIVAYIQNLIDAGDPDYVGYTYNVAKCERDSGYVIDALLHDLKYGGNESIYETASAYWDGNVAQIDGNRIPEYEAYQFAATLINTYILTNTLDPSPEQAVTLQVIDETKTAEANTSTRVTTLLNNVVSVIQNGLSNLPVLDVQLGRIEILGKIELEDLLLISNVTDNEILYNFAEPLKGGSVEFNEGNSVAYPQALSVSNGTTIIRFKTNTASMSSSDAIQIFLENTEIKTRPYDFGTDAIERMRVAQPQAMLDADFEYGLQPTKWQAISLMRGYPATYEVSASDIAVVNVTTDASTGTGGVGASLITVTTSSAHGLSAGGVITIRALANSVLGFARAEGTFIIFDIPTSTTFRYYAKAKVGTSNGDVLASSLTQLRSAAFYTGASVGTPNFSVFSQGGSGSFTTALRTEGGGNTLTFIGVEPSVGVPISGTSIPAGAQITGVFGDSNSDGIQDYKFVKTTYGPGTSAIELVDVNGLVAGMAVGNEASPNLLREITSIGGTTINLNGTVTVGKLGDQGTYQTSATKVTGAGTGCTLNFSVSGGIYTITGIAAGGTGYQQGDTLLVLGTALGSTSPYADAYVNVTSVSSGVVTAVSLVSGAGSGTNTYSGVATSNTTSRGSGVYFTIVRSAGSYTITNFGPNTMTNYFVGNRFTVAGTDAEGTSPTHDMTITITAESGGSPTAASVSGTAIRGDQIPVYSTVTISEPTTADVVASATINYSAIATIQVGFHYAHGFVPGSTINVAITSAGTNHALAAGPYSVEQVVDSTTIRYTARATGSIDTATTITGIVYARPDAYFTHRAFDGGVMLGTGGPQHGGHAIRQSKKYIRYQSGKGAMYNTGALFAPSFDIRSVTSTSTASGSVITVVMDEVDHGVQAGAVIRLSGIQTTGYNGNYTVTEIMDERTFRVVAQTALGSTTATIGSQCQMSLVNWHGAVVRSGPFDDQNGIFFQYDGNQLAVGRRSSTFQIAGVIAINSNENQVTGTNTRFLDQLQEGDRIVIRGMTHVVSGIASNTAMTVTPDFRGVNNINGVKVCKVQDTIIPQSEWNLDKCDGTGPSGYNVDVTKMQMIGIQFSWYGAGFIDWMFRGPDGNYIFCHRLKGNNLNTEAYMRTGNGPVRYEVLNEGARSRLNGALSDVATSIVLDDVTLFPTSGIVYVDNELISYSAKNSTTNTLTGCTRSTSLTNFAAGAVRTYTAGAAASHADNQGVILVSCTTSPIISHWGSAYLIDGNFDSDRGYIFNYAATGISTSIDKKTAFLIRLAPSVSNAVTGDLGDKELLNRAQLLLNALSVTSDSVSGGGAIVVEGVLNPNNYPTDPTKITWTGLNSSAAGGQPSFAQIALGGSVTWGGIPATTTTATVQGALTTTIAARSFAVVTYTVTAPSFTSATNATYARAISTTRNDFLITTASYDALTSTPLVVGDKLFVTTYITGGQTVSSITRNYITISGTPYTRIVMSSNGNANSPIPGTNGGANITITVTNTVSQTYNSAIRAGAADFLVTTSDYDSSGLLVGDSAINATYFPSKTISSVIRNYARVGNVLYTRITCNNSTSVTTSPAGTGNNQTMTITAATSAASYASTNYLFFTSASWISSGALLSTRVATSDAKFPAGTSVAGIETRVLGGVTVYKVTFTQSSNTSIAAAATVTFQFGDPQYALPGEQVFSFISNPGNTDTLTLDNLKELGTTAIGGRGTFPNGPDVLAINVYKVSGSATNTNLILRWGEAQA